MSCVLCCCFVFCLLLLAHSPTSSVIGHQMCTLGSNRSSVPHHTCSRSPINRFPLKALCFCVFCVREDCFFVERWHVWDWFSSTGLCPFMHLSLPFRGQFVSCLQFLLFLFVLLRAPRQTRIGKIPWGLHFHTHVVVPFVTSPG